MATLTGAQCLVYALEQIGVRCTFGIPGVHNTEIYDALARSPQIAPHLVTHEVSAAFMADAVSRTSSSVGTLVIVPGAGLTHAASGIGEAYLDGIPLLVVSGGTRRDSGRSFQIHQIDQLAFARPLCKEARLIETHDEIIPAVFALYQKAISGKPGPVFLEIPAEIQLFEADVGELPRFESTMKISPPSLSSQDIEEIAELLARAEFPALYLGWGARHATSWAVRVAELLCAPVATTMQGLSSFPGNHPLNVGMGFGASAPAFARDAFKDCDALLTIGASFGELATGSFGVMVPPLHIHIDIDPSVFSKNYPASHTLVADGADFLSKLELALLAKTSACRRDRSRFPKALRESRLESRRSWVLQGAETRKSQKLVGPGPFFESLRKIIPDDSILVLDDGNHTFLASELWEPRAPLSVLCPTDFNCMGYAVPAAIGAKLAHPEKTVIAVVGDGAFAMTGLELQTCTRLQKGVTFFVFCDGELGQISQMQSVPLKDKTCTILGSFDYQAFAKSVGALYALLNQDSELDHHLAQIFYRAESDAPMLVEVRVDYSRKTSFTAGAIKTNLGRFPLRERIRFISRALGRHLFE